jgi:hypothetical protein
MKHRLSHQQTEIIQLTGLVTFGFIPWAIVLTSFLFLSFIWGIIFAILITGLTFYFSLRIYKVEFDVDFLYLTRRLQKMKIDLNDIVTVKTFPFPVYLFLGQAYILSIVYTSANRRKRYLQYHEVYLVGIQQLTPSLKSSYLKNISELKNTAGNTGSYVNLF